MSRSTIPVARILVVDDEEPLRRFFQRALARKGYEPVMCNNGREALARFQEDPDGFDAVLTDFWMPDLNGVELAQRILEYRQIPIFLMSAYCEDWTRERVRLVGLRDLLHKPIDLNVMYAALESAVPV